MDVAALQSQLNEQLDPAGRAQLATLVDAHAALEQRLRALERMVFGPRSEKIDPVRSEVRRELTAAEVAAVAQRLAEEDGRSKPEPGDEQKARRVVGRARSETQRQAKKKSRVASLPIVTEVVEVTSEHLPAGMSLADFTPLGSSATTTRWELQRAHVVQVVFQMPKWQSRTDPSVIVHAPAPPSPQPGGKYGTSMFAHVVVQRVLNNMPLQRLSTAWRREGVDIAPSVLVDIFHRAADLLRPIQRRIIDEVRAAPYVCADETVQPMQAPGKGKTDRGWMWMGLCTTAIAYHFATSRSAEAGRELLGESVANLMVDGYSGYNGMTTSTGRAACWAHTRRLFWELRANWPEAVQILDAIRAIYRVEVQTLARSDDPGTLRRARDVDARPHVEAVFRIAASLEGQFPDTSAQGRAVGYVLRRRDELARFLGDPNVPLDNNISERALRIVAQGRKSSLFVGPGTCGTSLAVLLSVLRTCELLGVNPYDYLLDVLPKLAPLIERKDTEDDARAELDALTPASWAKRRAAT